MRPPRFSRSASHSHLLERGHPRSKCRPLQSDPDTPTWGGRIAGSPRRGSWRVHVAAPEVGGLTWRPLMFHVKHPNDTAGGQPSSRQTWMPRSPDLKPPAPAPGNAIPVCPTRLPTRLGHGQHPAPMTLRHSWHGCRTALPRASKPLSEDDPTRFTTALRPAPSRAGPIARATVS